MNSGSAATSMTTNRQEARQQLAQDQFGVGHARQQQQRERPPVLLLGHGAGGQQGGEEQRQGQLERRQDLEQDRAEPGQIAHVA